jgi:hypothetical protein
MAQSGQLAISDQALGLLAQLPRSGSSVVVDSSFSLRTLAELQNAAQVEFGLFEVGDANVLVRGTRFEVGIPKNATSVIAHSHPGASIFALGPSGADVMSLRNLNQTSSVIVNQAGAAVEFTSKRTLLRLWNTGEE